MAIVRTNPAFAHIAYRRAVVVKLVEELRENYMALSGDEPKKTIICEDVLREDSTVPDEAYLGVIEELELEAESLKLEMMKFQFTKREAQHGLLIGKKREAGDEVANEKSGAKGGRKRRR